MSVTAHLHPLSIILKQEIAMTSILLDTLQQEQIALLGKNASAIDHALTNKQQPTANLDKTSQQREAYLRQNNFPATAAGMLDCIEKQDPQGHHQLGSLWRQLNALGIQCLQQNHLNGNIIASRRLSVQTALTILRGSEPGHLACYTPTGQGQTKSDSHSLGQA